MKYLDRESEERLVEACKKGNRMAQLKLYRSYARAMYNLAFRIMNNREDAEDMLQESFAQCFSKIDLFRFESTFGSWLKRIVVNTCINEVRRNKPVIVLPENLPDIQTDENEEIRFDTARIFSAIAMLPDGYRIILTLYLLEGYDHEEISHIMGISESTSKSQYSRAKDKLRQMLK